MGGGSTEHNEKGYIHWTDGTSTKVQIKGSREVPNPPATYREALFAACIAPSFADVVRTPKNYLGVADKHTNWSIMVSEFLIGFTDLYSVFHPGDD